MAGAGSTLIGLKGKKYQLQSEKAKGGEGTVFVTGDPSVVVKVYHRPDAWTERKLKCMVRHPLNPYADGVHLLIAWPLDVVYENGTFVGYVMPFVKDTMNPTPTTATRYFRITTGPTQSRWRTTWRGR